MSNYFTFSTYTNALEIENGLKKIGKKLYVNSQTETFLKKSKHSPESGDILLFTEENSLMRYCERKSEFYFHPKEMEFRYMDDKFEFSEFLESIGEKPVPCKPFNQYNQDFPVYLKAKHSWKQGEKLPRGYICTSYQDFMKAISEIENKGYVVEDFFLQKLLDVTLDSNISVCGYFDFNNEDQNVLVVTSRLVSSDDGNKGTAALIKTMQDKFGLKQRAVTILRALRFKGVFELEFFYDSTENQYYVLELNPRFWLQHGFFIKYLDNVLIKKYLGMDNTIYESSKLENLKILWVDTTIFLRRKHIIQMTFQIIYMRIKGNRLYFSPGIFYYIKYLFKLKLFSK